jgi:serine/threonine-protein kinase
MAQAHRPRVARGEILDPGYRIDDDLTVVGHLGGSRKVDIYICRSRKLKDIVACKVLRPEFCLDFSALEAVLEEGDILAHIRHPNIIEGYGVELEEHPRILMEYVQGQTLKDAFFGGNFEAFDLDDAVAGALQLADALTYIHTEGFLHLDVKSSNVMYYEDHATLIDFSVAERFSPEKPLRDNAGTTESMAPEQTYRREVGYATDVFGLGVVFYQLLTGGELPYAKVEDQPKQSELGPDVWLDYDTPPKMPSEYPPGSPVALDAVALKAIEPDIAARYQTPAEFKSALEAAI